MRELSILQRSLAVTTTQEGTIVAVAGDNITIATPSGSYLARRQVGDVTLYGRGDSVQVREGFLTGISVPKSRSIRYPIR